MITKKQFIELAIECGWTRKMIDEVIAEAEKIGADDYTLWAPLSEIIEG